MFCVEKIYWSFLLDFMKHFTKLCLYFLFVMGGCFHLSSFSEQYDQYDTYNLSLQNRVLLNQNMDFMDSEHVDIDSISVSDVDLELKRFEREGLLTLSPEDFIFQKIDLTEAEPVDIFFVKNLSDNSSNKSSSNSSNKSSSFADVELQDDYSVTRIGKELEQKAIDDEAKNEIFALVNEFNVYKAQLEKLNQDRDQIKLDFKMSLHSLLEQLDKSLRQKRWNLMNTLLSGSIKRFQSLKIRREVQSIDRKLQKIHPYVKGFSEPQDPFDAKFLDLFEPEIIEPFAKREELIDNSIYLAIKRMEAASKRIDDAVRKFESSSIPWWQDPVLSQARYIRDYKATRHAVKTFSRENRRR